MLGTWRSGNFGVRFSHVQMDYDGFQKRCLCEILGNNLVPPAFIYFQSVQCFSSSESTMQIRHRFDAKSGQVILFGKIVRARNNHSLYSSGELGNQQQINTARRVGQPGR